MTNNKTKYFHLYPFCELIEEGSYKIGKLLGVMWGKDGVRVLTDCSSNEPYWGNGASYKMVLRPLTDITQEEAQELYWLVLTDGTQKNRGEEPVLIERCVGDIEITSTDRPYMMVNIDSSNTISAIENRYGTLHVLHGTYMNNAFYYMRMQGFDVDNLIDNGIAKIKKMSNTTEIKPRLIYGLISGRFPNGVQAYAVDANTGEVLDTHFCSSDGFAKSDLGFSDPLFQKVAFSDDTHSTVSFNQRRHEKYDSISPNGYILEWIGDISCLNPVNFSICNRGIVNYIEKSKTERDAKRIGEANA